MSEENDANQGNIPGPQPTEPAYPGAQPQEQAPVQADTQPHGEQTQPVPPAPAAPYGQQPTQQYQPPVYENQTQQHQAPMYNNQQGQAYYGQPPVAPISPSGNGKAMGALICGILAILFSWTVIIGVILGVVAIVLAVQAVKASGKDGKATGGKVCGIVGIAFSIITLFIYIFTFAIIGAAISDYEGRSSSYSYVAPDVPDSRDSSSDSSNGQYGSTEDEQAVEVEMERVLEGIANPSDQEISDLAKSYDQEFTDALGFSMADAGIDPTEVVKSSLKSITYSLDGAFAYSDGTASAYADTTSIGIWDYLMTFDDELDSMTAAGTTIDLDAVADRAKVAEVFKASMDKAEPSENYVMVNFTKTGESWAVDQESLEEQTEYIFGTY